MNCIEKTHQLHSVPSLYRERPPARWRIGNGSVSTDELRAWQLGPARVDTWLVACEPQPRTRG